MFRTSEVSGNGRTSEVSGNGTKGLGMGIQGEDSFKHREEEGKTPFKHRQEEREARHTRRHVITRTNS